MALVDTFFRAGGDVKRLISVGKADMVSPNSRQRSSELKSDKPGRSYSSSRSGARHALEPPHDYQKLEKHRFMATLADTLEGACTKENLTVSSWCCRVAVSASCAAFFPGKYRSASVRRSRKT
jgi:hypothetical protein